MARAQDAQTITGGGVDPYVQQSLMQNKQLASNRLVAAMQESGATQRQQMAGQQQMEQQKLAGEQAMARTAAETAAEDRRAAEAERGRREDREMQRKQGEETRSLTERLADRQLAFEKAIGDRDFDTAEQRHREMMAELRVSRRVAAEQARDSAKLIVAQYEFLANKDLAGEKRLTAITEMKNQADLTKGAYEQALPRIKENFLADTRFDILIRPEVDSKAVFRGPLAQIAMGARGIKELWEHRSASVRDAIQRQARGNGSNIGVSDLTSAGYATLEQKVAAGDVREKDIRAMYTVLEASKDAIREKLTTASDREAKEWNAQLLMVDSYEATLNRLKTSTGKLAGDENRTVGSVGRTALDVVQGEGIPGMIGLISQEAASTEDAVNKWIAELRKSVDVDGRKLMYEEGDDEETMKRIDEMNIGRGLSISKPSIPIGGR